MRGDPVPVPSSLPRSRRRVAPQEPLGPATHADAACHGGTRRRLGACIRGLGRGLGFLALGCSLGGCYSLDRLRWVGDTPGLSAIENPTAQAGYKPVQMPMPAPQPAIYQPNSLWRTGSRAFFKDQRAHQVGDILTVKVRFADKATVENETQRSRKNSEDSGIDNFFGKPKVPIMNTPVPTRIFTGDSTSSSDGKGSVDRKEELITNIAGVVTQVLPNGNLVIEGKQEVRVNFEIRELIVAGIVRPEDIESDNTIEFDQDRGSPHRLWRPRPTHRCAAAALRPAGARRPAAVLTTTDRRWRASAADLKFLHHPRQIRLGTSNRKAALES